MFEKILKMILKISIPKLQLGQRLDKIIASILKKKYSRSCIQQWILKNNVKLDGKTINKPKKIINGKEITINYDLKKSIQLVAQNIKLDVIHEDKDIIIINKKNGMIVHPGAGNLQNTILNGLIYYYPNNIHLPRAGIVHRLDKNTTGLMVIAKNINSYFFLIESMKNRKIKREYDAITTGILKINGTIDEPIKRHCKKRTTMMVHPQGKKAVTHYKIIENFKYHTHLKINLETGRTHQIRVHMAYINHFLTGDQLYKNKKIQKKNIPEKLSNKIKNFNRQALHASLLKLNHPNNGKSVTYKSSIPEDMKMLVYILKSFK